jgi:hypothetical protein
LTKFFLKVIKTTKRGERIKGEKMMDRKDCFGSLKEVNLNQSHTTTQARPECRTCEEIRDCLRYSKQLAEEEKEKDELNKQNMIAQIIDHSHIISNEIGSCLLEFLSRLYSSPLGVILFKNLFLFYEIPPNSISSNFSISISRTMLDLLQGEKIEPGDPSLSQATKQQGRLEEGFALQIVLFQRYYPKNPKANMGMIASEVARVFASDDVAVKQILQTLSDVERDLFKKMDIDRRANWLIGKWGFLDEFEALKKEMEAGKEN